MSVQEFEIPYRDYAFHLVVGSGRFSSRGMSDTRESDLFTQVLDMTNFTSDSQAMRIQSALQKKSQKVLKDVEIDADNVYMRNKQFKLKEPNFFDRLMKLATTKLF